MLVTIILLVGEIAGIVLARSVFWKRLMKKRTDEVPLEKAKPIMASLLRVSGHLWLLLAFLPVAVLVETVLNVGHLETVVAGTLALAALGLIVWCGSRAAAFYRLAWRISRL